MATAALIHHAMTSGQALKGAAIAPMSNATPAASGTGGSSSSSTDDSSATISANDFLTLLVTEMQNQDPTADTDPNEYIDQLVQVNSLEQLIDINQTLSTDLGSPAGATGGTSTQAAGAAATPSAANSIAAPQAATRAAGVRSPAVSGATTGTAVTAPNAAPNNTAGNTSTARLNAAAQRVAHALNGQHRTRTARGGSPATQ